MDGPGDGAPAALVGNLDVADSAKARKFITL